jgi:hypothetical protein
VPGFAPFIRSPSRDANTIPRPEGAQTMAVHRVVFSRAQLAGIQRGVVTCALRTNLIVAPGDILLAGLPTYPALARLKVTGFRRQVSFLGLTKRELQRAGVENPQNRAEALLELASGPNPTVNVIHFRIMKS